MLYFFGVGDRVLNEKVLPGEHVEGCGGEGVTVYVVSIYLHLFWIPFISIGKTVKAICNQTGYDILERGFTKRMGEEGEILKATSRLPIRHFAGLLFILIGVGYALVKGVEAKRSLADTLKEPLYGDVYFMRDKTEEYPFYMMRSLGMDSGEVNVLISESAYNHRRGLVEDFENGLHNRIGYFVDTAMYGLTMETIDSLYDVGAIVDLKRDPSFSFQSTLQQPIDSTDLEE